MKSILLSISALLITLISVSTVNAQAVKFHLKDPPVQTATYITLPNQTSFQICSNGTVYGCGNASSVRAYLEVKGSATTLCYNSGNDPGPIPGQTDFTIKSEELEFAATNGHASYSLCAELKGSCKGKSANWSTEVKDVKITALTLFVNGKAVNLFQFSIAGL